MNTSPAPQTTPSRSVEAADPPPDAPSTGDTVAALYTAVAEGDLNAAAALLDPDAVLHVPGTHAVAGDHRGRDAVLAFVTGISEVTDRTENVDVVDLMSGATHAAVYCRVSGTRAGHEDLGNTTVHVLRVDHGVVHEIWFHNWDQVAVDRFWS